MLKRVAQKNAENAARIAEASLKASEAFIDRQNYTLNYRRRRALLKKERTDYEDRNQLRRGRVVQLRQMRQLEKDAKTASKEDWDLGPLAPKRDIGELRDKFATVTSIQLHSHELTPGDLEKEKKILGNNKFCLHDRVVIIKGKDTGKIGEVTDVDEDAMAVRVQGIGGVDFAQPEWMAEAQNDPRKYLPNYLKVPMRNLRLIATIEKDGKREEVIVDHMEFRKRLVPGKSTDHARIKPGYLNNKSYTIQSEEEARAKAYSLEEGENYEETTDNDNYLADVIEEVRREPERWAKGKVVHGYKWQEYRVIPGLDQEIVDLTPKEEQEGGYDPDAEYYDDDTLAITVDAQTYSPYLTYAPFPPSVIDELRNKRSRIAPTNRIDEVFLEPKEKKAADLELKKIQREEKMRTPLQEIKERRLEVEKELLAKRAGDENTLMAQLGAAMLKKQASGHRLEQIIEAQKHRTIKSVARQRKEEASRVKKLAADEAKAKKELESDDRTTKHWAKLGSAWPTDKTAQEAIKAERRKEKWDVLHEAELLIARNKKEGLLGKSAELEQTVYIKREALSAARKKRETEKRKREVVHAEWRKGRVEKVVGPGVAKLEELISELEISKSGEEERVRSEKVEVEAVKRGKMAQI